ncbi:Nucleoporin seh1-B [Blattella germanica]|nr:Nucleoporin seh1-B [Blattella germanica]
MFEAHSINAEHKDLIHDVAYDYYGQRMATCSSDQFVKVWDQDEHENWHLTANWKAHSGSVWKVTWAHPEFGQVLATCSFDRTAAVWEEIVGEGSVPGERGMRHWVRRTNLVDSRTSVTDIKFAPKSLGLLLATCSADGVMRIYEAPDVMNLSQWTLQHEVSCKLPCSCISWNPSFSRLHPPMLAVGSDDANPANGSKVFIYEYSENTRRWTKTETLSNVTDAVHDLTFAPNLGRSYHLLAIATNNFDDHYSTVWRVCWNITGTILASSGDDNSVRLWKGDRWQRVVTLDEEWVYLDDTKSIEPYLKKKKEKRAALTSKENARKSFLKGLGPSEEAVLPTSKWQAPVIKGRFQKMTWLGSDPPPPPIEKNKTFKK